ncbi:IME4 Transcriptional activator, adenine-specific DNA methyltransferase [uncultured Caudovirales phage]|uniref:IME4 Transcriptional activator, adenine-specific DNA methyltransferase n=1 Tax=uncultured Caudovirales phage TaxID=2100421 RepID=A0A6J5NKE8_9CAUD|nr:IME4 Transcriptional activator, adenine-specific DNA methyltransferase [uncultured Caudovirales phage]
MEIESKKYQIIYADPPWHFNDRIRSSKKLDDGKMQFRELELHYKTMKTNEICSLPIEDIAEDNAVLFMWTTDSHLSDALKVIEAWGFTYKTIGFVWNKKTNTGKQVCYMGKWTMKGSEICLLATKGKAHSLIKSHKVRQLVEAERSIHSRKPNEVRNRIVELLGDIPRVELFAREAKPGWDSWGNEIQNTIEL